MKHSYTPFVVVLAALLMALPVQAQKIAKKNAPMKQLEMREMGNIRSTQQAIKELKQKGVPQTKAQRAVRAKAEGKRLEGRPFAEAKPTKQPKTSHGKGLSENKAEKRRVAVRPRPMSSKAVRAQAPADGQEVVDEHGIIVSPAAGTRQVFTRSGWTFDNADNMNVIEQTGTVHIVTCADGTVYVRDILTNYPAGTWVKGTLDVATQTLTIPTRQPIYYNSIADCTYSIGWGFWEDSMISNADGYANSFTFKLDITNFTLKLEGAENGLFMGLFWDDDDAFAWEGDFGTVWTYSSEFKPMDPVSVTPPATLSTEEWYAKGHVVVNDQKQLYKGTATVGVDGNNVYVKGFFSDYPNAWMKGEIDGTDVTFNGLQTLVEEDGTPIYGVGANGSDLAAFRMTYSAEDATLTSVNRLLANTDATDVKAKTMFADITLSKADPFAPISTFPYENVMDENGFEMFSVIDANEDGKTWLPEEGATFYKYNEEQAADDWLISPAFVLEAGKFYTVAVDAFCSSLSFPESIEVKMGNNESAEAMTADVIGRTDIDWEEPQTLTNKVVSVAETGTYFFGIHAVSEADRAALKVSRFFVDETIVDAPVAVSNLSITPDPIAQSIAISFDVPTKNIGGNDLTSTVNIEIVRDGETLKTYEGQTPGTTIAFTDENVAVGVHTYTFNVSNSFGKGESTTQNVWMSAVYDVPYVANFAQDNEAFAHFTTINANNDGSYWEDNATYAAYEYDSENDADDYLVTPGLRLEAGKRYNIVVRAEAAGEYTERFEVKIGKEATVEGLNTTVIPATELTGLEPIGGIDVEGVYACTESGIYNVAIHCISDADMYTLMIHKLTVEMAPELTAPAAPSITVTPDATGEKRTEVNIIAPTVDNAGNPLTNNLTKIELYRDDNLLTEFSDIVPGQTISYTDADIEENGNHNYQAIPYNADGVGMKSPIVSAFVGFDVPAQVENFAAEDNVSSIHFSWDKVTTGRNGGLVKPEEIDYIIYECERGTTLFNDTPVGAVRDADHYELEQPTNEGEQDYQLWYIAAANEAGESYLSEEAVSLIMGKPYDLPCVENWAGGTASKYWDSNSFGLNYSVSSDGDGAAMALASQEEDSDIFITSGKLNLNDAANPTLIVDAAGFGVSSINIIGKIDENGEAVELGTFDLTEEYQTIKVSLSQLKGGNYAHIGFTAHINAATTYDPFEGSMSFGDALIIDNIRVIDQFKNDLGVELIAPEEILAGKSTYIGAMVTNWGEDRVKDFVVTIKSGDEVLLQEKGNLTLAPYARDIYAVELKTTVFSAAGEMPLTANVAFAADENAANNDAAGSINVVEPFVPAPENLQAEGGNMADVNLSWNASSETILYTESFEDDMAGWTTIDADQDGNDWVYHNNALDEEALMATNSGEGSVYSESYSNAASTALTPDNWLISPRVVLDGEFSFYAMGQDANYCNEHFAIYVSTGDPTDVNSFEQVSEEFVATGDMAYYSADLSSYAGQKGYVAIRHFNVTDQYVLVVDDATYTMDGEADKYNIYYEGTLVATVEGSETTYAVSEDNFTTGEHQFAVTAVYANGMESKPVTTTLSVVSGIEDLQTDSASVDVYSLDGKLLHRQTTSLHGLKGVYVVGGKKVMIK